MWWTINNRNTQVHSHGDKEDVLQLQEWVPHRARQQGDLPCHLLQVFPHWRFVIFLVISVHLFLIITANLSCYSHYIFSTMDHQRTGLVTFEVTLDNSGCLKKVWDPYFPTKYEAIFTSSLQNFLGKWFNPFAYCSAQPVKYPNTSLAAPGALAYCLQHLTTWLIQNGRRGREIGQPLGYWSLWLTSVK